MLQITTCIVNKFLLSIGYYKIKRHLYSFSGPGMICSPKKTPALTHIYHMWALKKLIFWAAFMQKISLSHSREVLCTHRELRQGLWSDRFYAHLHNICAAPAANLQGSLLSLYEAIPEGIPEQKEELGWNTVASPACCRMDRPKSINKWFTGDQWCTATEDESR